MNKNIKLLVSDYDDTFFTSQINIKKNIKAVKKFQKTKNVFIIATGRDYNSIKEKIVKYKVPYDFLIINHGATLLDKNDKIIKSFRFTNKELFSINKIIDAYQKFIIDVNKFKDLELIKEKENYYTKVMIIFNDLNKAKIVCSLVKQTKNLNAFLISRNNSLPKVEIVMNNVDKLVSIEYVRKKLGILIANTITVGDAQQDYKMIKNYNGYAMNNSCEMIKEVAIQIIDHVYEIIEQFVSE